VAWTYSTTTSHHFFRSCIGWELSSGSSSSSQYSSSTAWTAWPCRTYPATYYVCQTWRLFNVCVRRHRRRSSSRRHAFPPPVTALSPWLQRGHGTACRDLSHRYLHWRPLDVSWRRNCSSELFLLSTALPTIASDRYSVLTLRRTRVLSLSLAFVRCPCSLLTLRHLNLFFLW